MRGKRVYFPLPYTGIFEICGIGSTLWHSYKVRVSSTTPCGWPSGTLNKLGVSAPRLGTIECKGAELMGMTTVFRWEYFVPAWTTHSLTYFNCFPKPKYYWDQKFLSPAFPQQQTKMKIWSQKPAACPSWYWFWFHDSLVTLGHILSISQESSFSSFIKWCKLCKFKGNLDAWSPWSWAFQRPIIPPLAI